MTKAATIKPRIQKMFPNADLVKIGPNLYEVWYGNKCKGMIGYNQGSKRWFGDALQSVEDRFV